MTVRADVIVVQVGHKLRKVGMRPLSLAEIRLVLGEIGCRTWYDTTYAADLMVRWIVMRRPMRSHGEME